MKTAPAGLLTLFGTSQFYMADCYTFTLADGIVLRYTSADQTITDQATGNQFGAVQPYFERSKVKFGVGVQVDDLAIKITGDSTSVLFTGGPTWFQALVAGQFDGAEVQLDRAFMATPGAASAFLLTMFYGRVTEVDVDRTVATIKANTHMELLNLQWPWRVYQPGCARTLYDAGCTLNPASFSNSATVTSGSTVNVIHSNYSQATDTATLGTVTFTSGVLNGLSFTIQKQTSGNLTVFTPLPSVPAVGDTMTVYFGCDHTLATCNSKFSNLQHFAGQPTVPVPESAA